MRVKPLSGADFNAIALQLTTTYYKSFLESFRRKSGKKVQNAEVKRRSIALLGWSFTAGNVI
jgi:hypothetical protein